MEDHSNASHYALLIGICFTPKERRQEWPPLKGCIRDVQEITEQLDKSSLRVNVRVLTASVIDLDAPRPFEDEKDLPSHSNIISNLEEITSRASTGNFIYVHFTGHGTTLEPTGLYANSHTGELALVVIASDDATKIQYLRGSELAYQLNKMVEKGLKVTIVLDCCFSGSIVRDKVDPLVRYLPYSLAVDTAYPPLPGRSLSLKDETMQSVFRGASMLPNWLVNPDGYTVLTASGPGEKALELELGADGRRGVLSYFLARTFNWLGRVGGKLQRIYAHLCARFGETNVPHRPMLYGNKSLYFFEDAKYGDDATAIPVINKNGNLILEAGQAHGVCDGDEFTLSFGRPTEHGSREDLMIIKGIHARALTSDLRLLGTAPVSLASGMTATANTRLTLRRFPVRLELRLPCHNVWEMALQKRPSLDIHYTDNANASSIFKFHVILVAKHCYEICNESNQRIPDLPTFYDLDENPDYVLDIVQHLAKFKMVENLVNSSLAESTNAFKELFSVQVVDTMGKEFHPGCRQFGQFYVGCSHPECLIEVKDGNKVELIVRNKAREGGGPLYFHLYSLGSCWEIENLIRADYDVIPPHFSNQDDNDFKTGTTGVWKKKIIMTVPQEIRDKGQHQCDDIFKLFLTARPTSFMSLEQPEVGKLARQHKDSKDRGGKADSASEDWAALNFRVRTYI
jgi:hypothetical protein